MREGFHQKELKGDVEMLPDILYIYLGVVNLAAFALFGIDKRRARKHRWRIPERRLLAISAAGGSLGALTGMYVFRHKTRHRLFAWGVPLLFLAHIGLLVLAIGGVRG